MTSTPAPEFCLLVIAKAPVPGLAKTRLCPPATPSQAAEIAAASLLDTLDTVLATPGARPVVALAGEVVQAARGSELGALLDAVTVVPQGDGDLAQRLARVLGRSATLCPGLPTLLIGMDTPQVTSELLARAADWLRATDALLGPATDGGWWLLGTGEPPRARMLARLREVPMSRSDTAELTLCALEGAGLRTALAPAMSDVDTMDDALAVAADAPGGRFAGAVATVSGPMARR